MRLARVLSLVAVVLFGTVGSAHAQSEFLANLSGTNEVPAVATGGFGSAVLDVNVAGGTVGITFELTGVNLTDAFMGHIHCGAAGQNGPVIVWLAGQPAGPPTSGYNLNGIWVRATVTEKSIIASPNCGSTIGDLLQAMVAGNTYVNIHTRANPGGEIRGQIQIVGPLVLP